MDKEEMLQALFSSIGAEYGYQDVTAGFTPEKDMKIVWMRSVGWIDFWISDYLEDAPADVLESIADTMFNRLNRHERIAYPESLVDYITSEDFRTRNLPLYLSRINGVSKGMAGRHMDLSDSYRRLIDRGLLSVDPNITVRWAPMMESAYVGHSSILMRTACISRRLDNMFVPKELLDFILYSQIVFAQQEYDQEPSKNITLAMETLEEYPEYERLMKDLKEMGLKLWKEVSPAN